MFTWESTDATKVGQVCQNPVVFFKVRQEWGGLSNMSNDFPLCVNGVRVSSSEALYQAMRFPHQPEWQQEILAASHAMQSKMVAKKEGRRANHSRPDWDVVRVDVMRWVLRVKLAQNWQTFGALLKETGNRAIVELSRKDDFWGAKSDVVEPTRLRGENVLGQLLMELRDELLGADHSRLRMVTPPRVPGFRLLGEEIRRIDTEPHVALLSEGAQLTTRQVSLLERLLGRPNEMLMAKVRGACVAGNTPAAQTLRMICGRLRIATKANELPDSSPVELADRAETLVVALAGEEVSEDLSTPVGSAVARARTLGNKRFFVFPDGQWGLESEEDA